MSATAKARAMYSHILVTGGAGFVGSHLAIALRESFPSTSVTAFDNLGRRGSELNLGLLREHGVVFRHGDVRSAEDLAFPGPPPELIIDCSAEPSAQAGYGRSPEFTVKTNLLGTFHCLELARRVQADLLLVSTSRVYPYRALNSLALVEEETRFALKGEQSVPGASGCGITEEFPLDGARSIYGMTKLASELMALEYADAYGFRCVVNRCGLISGPRQMGKSDQGVIVLWLASHYFGRPLRYIGFGGSGKQVRDVLHIDDFCGLAVDEARNFELYAGRPLNVGGGTENSVSLLEITELCAEITGRRIQIAPSPENRPADVKLYITDNSKISAINGWRPKRNVRGCLEDVHEWLRSNEGILKATLGFG